MSDTKAWTLHSDVWPAHSAQSPGGSGRSRGHRAGVCQLKEGWLFVNLRKGGCFFNLRAPGDLCCLQSAGGSGWSRDHGRGGVLGSKVFDVAFWMHPQPYTRVD